MLYVILRCEISFTLCYEIIVILHRLLKFIHYLSCSWLSEEVQLNSITLSEVI